MALFIYANSSRGRTAREAKESERKPPKPIKSVTLHPISYLSFDHHSFPYPPLGLSRMNLLNLLSIDLGDVQERKLVKPMITIRGGDRSSASQYKGRQLGSVAPVLPRWKASGSQSLQRN